MNKKIKQLAEQAGFYYTDKTGFITPAGCDPEKFAELIVRECAYFSMVATDDHYDVEALYKHFGIE